MLEAGESCIAGGQTCSSCMCSIPDRQHWACSGGGGIPQSTGAVQMSAMLWPISECWKCGRWSRPSPERLLWEHGSISSQSIYTAAASIEAQRTKIFHVIRPGNGETERVKFSLFLDFHFSCVRPLARDPKAFFEHWCYAQHWQLLRSHTHTGTHVKIYQNINSWKFQCIKKKAKLKFTLRFLRLRHFSESLTQLMHLCYVIKENLRARAWGHPLV